jgi:hypothetical protein
MPRSADEARPWIHEQMERMGPGSVLDVGPGVGTYRRALSDLPLGPWTCVEVWEPYVGIYGLREQYDTVIVADIRDHEWQPVDYVILGDVLEHLPYTDALTVWANARANARKAVVLSLPIYPYPQGPLEGNHHETHLHDWSTAQVLAELAGITSYREFSIVGAFLAERPSRGGAANHRWPSVVVGGGTDHYLLGHVS